MLKALYWKGGEMKMVTTDDEPGDEDFNLRWLDRLNREIRAMKDKLREESARADEQHEVLMKDIKTLIDESRSLRAAYQELL